MRLVRTQTKGMVTIPIEFRQKLNISPNNLLEVKLVDNGVMFVKVDYVQPNNELYSDEEIEKWLKDDKLDPKIAKKIAKLIKNQ